MPRSPDDFIFWFVVNPPMRRGVQSNFFVQVCLRGTSRLGLFHREAPGATSLTVLLFFMPVRPSRLFFARIIFIENWQLRESSKLKKQQRERLLTFAFCSMRTTRSPIPYRPCTAIAHRCLFACIYFDHLVHFICTLFTNLALTH